MIFRVVRLFSKIQKNLYPLVIESSFDQLRKSIYNESNTPSIIKIFYHLYTNSRMLNFYTNWNSNKDILSAMNQMTPFIPSVEDRVLNSFIVTLGYMGIAQNPIWKPIETKFINSSHKVLEHDYIPISVSAFSISKCENQLLWDILIKKISEEFIAKHSLCSNSASLIYKSLLYSGQGTQLIFNQMKKFILDGIHEIKPQSVSGILGALSFTKQIDYELTKPILNQLSSNIEQYEGNELCRILGNLNLLLLDKKAREMVEQGIINKKSELNLKDIVSCFSIYTQKRTVSLDFPKILFDHYMKNRSLLMQKIEGSDTMAALDMRMLGCALELSIEIPDKFFLQVLDFIKKSKINIGNSKNLQINKKMIDNYILFHKFRV